MPLSALAIERKEMTVLLLDVVTLQKIKTALLSVLIIKHMESIVPLSVMIMKPMEKILLPLVFVAE